MVLPDVVAAFVVVFLRRRRLCVVVDVDDGVILISQHTINQKRGLDCALWWCSNLALAAALFDIKRLFVAKLSLSLFFVLLLLRCFSSSSSSL